MPDVDRRPTAIILKSVIAVSSARTAIGADPLPGSLQSSPDIFGQTSATVLCLGCVVSVIGIFWQRARRPRARLDGLVIEQFGLLGVIVGALMYAYALSGVPQFSDAAIAFGMALGLGSASIWQYRVIRRYRRSLLNPPTMPAPLLPRGDDDR